MLNISLILLDASNQHVLSKILGYEILFCKFHKHMEFVNSSSLLVYSLLFSDKMILNNHIISFVAYSLFQIGSLPNLKTIDSILKTLCSPMYIADVVLRASWSSAENSKVLYSDLVIKPKVIWYTQNLGPSMGQSWLCHIGLDWAK